MLQLIFKKILIIVIILLSQEEILAQEERSFLPLPRFVSLKEEVVNVRAGPGLEYPIKWQYMRSSIPLEIIEEYGKWRQIRDWDDDRGWVHMNLLSNKRTVVITDRIRELRHFASSDSGVIVRVEPGVFGSLLRCSDDWCQIGVKKYKGWLLRDEFWGVYSQENIN